MTQHNKDLFYDICNTINDYNQRQNHYLEITTTKLILLMIPIQFDI